MELEGLDLLDEVKMGMMMSGADRASILARARQLDASGLHSLWVGDHIAFHIPVVESSRSSPSSRPRPSGSSWRRVCCCSRFAIRP